MTFTHEAVRVEYARIDDQSEILHVLQESSIVAYATPLGLPEEQVRAYETRPEKSEKLLSRWGSLLDEGVNDTLVVARSNKGIVGYAESIPAVESDEGVNLLHGLYLLPDWQMRGLGSALLKAVLSPYKNEATYLETVEGTAESFYERHGFSLTGQRHLSKSAHEYELRLMLVEMMRPPIIET
jgi:predicted N-acetyltransferase YhbS